MFLMLVLARLPRVASAGLDLSEQGCYWGALLLWVPSLHVPARGLPSISSATLLLRILAITHPVHTPILHPSTNMLPAGTVRCVLI